jgi:predicted ATP-grasp superfamily ATP-dependent carboligase
MITKWRLFEVCADARVETPSTWIVEGNEIPEGFRLTGRFPVVLKPQSRVGLMHWTRGRLCRNAAELSEAIAWFRESVRPSPWALADEPRAGDPLIQEFIARPGHEVYHLVGYRSKAGESVIAAHRKLLQYPLRFGSGLCFETAEVDGRAADKLERLLGGIGFHGIFEAEYVERDGELLLIDLNPRAYNGMSLETRRGFDLPWYLYLDALGESALLSEELATARALPFTRMVWRDSVRFWTMLAGQTLSGGLSLRETRRWIAWARANRGGIMDPYFVADDKRAGFGFIRDFVGDAFTEPRAFVGNYVRRGLDR